jgi:site-specific recombinase XerD
MSTTFKEFMEFCGLRSISPFDCTPAIINLFLLHSAQKGKSYGYIERFLSALSFLYRFFLVHKTIEQEVLDVKRFMETPMYLRKKVRLDLWKSGSAVIK